MERKKIINICPFFSAVTNINSWRVKSALSNVVSLGLAKIAGSQMPNVPAGFCSLNLFRFQAIVYLYLYHGRVERKDNPDLWCSRPTLSQFWSFEIRRTTFKNYIKFVDLRILKLWNCERARRVRKLEYVRTFLRGLESDRGLESGRHSWVIRLSNSKIDAGLKIES